MHVRAQIREFVATVVEAADPQLAGRTSRSRVYPADQLPAAAVYFDEEVAIDGAEIQLREGELIVEILAKVSTDLDNTLDALAEAIETAMAQDTLMGGLAKDLRLDSTSIELDDELEKPAGALRQTWTVTYRVDTRAPGSPVN